MLLEDHNPKLPTPNRINQTSDFCNLTTASSQVPAGQPKTCSDLRPVGGCLAKNLHAWRQITNDPWILGVIRDGYAPLFTESRPTLTRDWWAFDSIKPRTPPDTKKLLIEHVEELLIKQAIEPVRNKHSHGYYSLMFLVPKKNGKLRPIIDLTVLNDYLVCPKFKMESSISVAASVQPKDWGTSLDLKDAYFHVPIALAFRKYLRIVVNGKAYQYKALPFGLSTSPLVFSKMLEPLAVHLHSRGIILHRYLDDFLIRSQSRILCQEWTDYTLYLLFFLGWGVSLEKSDLDPSQEFIYIGVLFNTLLGLMFPPQDRVDNIIRAGHLLLETIPHARDWATFIGLISSAERQVPFGRIRIRPIQQCFRRQFSWIQDPVSKTVLLDPPARNAVTWWTNPVNLRKGVPLGPYIPDVTLYTDACKVSWGAHAPNFEVSGFWTPLEETYSINALELLAIVRALQHRQDYWKSKKILVATDNSTAVAYINKQGGTRSQRCLEIT